MHEWVTQRWLLTEVGGFRSHQGKCVYFYHIGSVSVCWNSSEHASCGVVLQIPGETGEPRLTALVLCMKLGARSLQHNVILTPLFVTSCVAHAPSQIHFSVHLLKWTSIALQCPISRPYVGGKTPSWSVLNVGTWDVHFYQRKWTWILKKHNRYHRSADVVRVKLWV